MVPGQIILAKDVLNAAREGPVPHLRPPSAAEDTQRHTDVVDMLLRPPTAAEDTQRHTVAVAMSLRPRTVAEDIRRRTDVGATWHQGQPIAADAMLHRPHTAADVTLHREASASPPQATVAAP